MTHPECSDDRVINGKWFLQYLLQILDQLQGKLPHIYCSYSRVAMGEWPEVFNMSQQYRGRLPLARHIPPPSSDHSIYISRDSTKSPPYQLQEVRHDINAFRPVYQVDCTELQSKISDKVPESSHIEFKKEFSSKRT